ncbi:unnamed protein product [Symbiodinium sp. CCMP2592]|nr:unnamed protein product [Symbiodinium sp. CCMP2592]
MASMMRPTVQVPPLAAPTPSACAEGPSVPRIERVPPLVFAAPAALYLARGSRRWRRLSRSKARPAQVRCSATAVKEHAMEGELIAQLDTGSLVLWLLPQHALRLAAWLSEWEGRSHGSHEGNFWRQRMIVAMKKRLESAAFDEPPRGGAPASDFRVYSVHQAPAEAPLAIAAVSDRPFPLEPLGALHVDAIVTQPDASARGLGAVLLRCLVQQAAAANQVLVLEPQSAGLEAYFTRLGFQHIEELDPYLWVPSGALPGRDVDVRYVLVQDEDYQRLVAAFKRPPAWTGVTEEIFLSARQDTAALDVMALRVSSQGTSRRAFARRMQREAPGRPYKAGDVEDVDPAEVMAIMRGPEKLEEVDWACAEDFGGGTVDRLRRVYK